ncbi:hypothetical protein P2318_18185 [Myxococcaceae bacterium GXIMD 01537]
MYRSLLLAAVLTASTALAQEEEYEVPTSLEGVGRLSIQSGWRLTSNETFYEGYYAANSQLERGPMSNGGPLVIGSFAYSISDLIELGVDLFATGERLRLTNQPTLTTMTYGALLAVRFQTVLPQVGPYGFVPFMGILSGPTLAYSVFEGQKANEVVTQTWAGTLGGTLRLSPRWGLTAEYRLSFVRGQVAPPGGLKLGSYNGGGNWFALGVTYTWPPEPSRKLGGGAPF